MEKKAPGHLGYRPDIDGLRAIAVLSVVGYHAFPNAVKGGFIGVDIFFVISGYLITTIILGDLARGVFSYRTFYARRIRRIFPALVLVIVAVWAIGWFRLMPDQFRQLGSQIAGGAAFVSNFVLRGQAGYFDGDAETKPLLHLWSLAIEEQFYIFWPLILGLLIRVGAKIWTATAIIVAIAVASFAFNLFMIGMEPTTAFYSPFSRFFELMIGGLLAQSVRTVPTRFSSFPDVWSALGFALIAWSLATFGGGAFPGWRAAVPSLGAFFVIAAGPDAWLNRLVLSNRLAVWFGKISYPLYLWHWPLLSYAVIDASMKPGRFVRAGLVATSLLLAWLTYRFVESPIRTSRDFRSLPIALFASLAAVGIVGLVTYQNDGFPGRFGERGVYAARFDESLPNLRYSTEHHLNELTRQECNFYDYDAWQAGHSTNRPRLSIPASCYTRPASAVRTVFIWGDSHAQHLNSGLRRYLPESVALLQVATSGCDPKIVTEADPAALYCERSNQFALATMRKQPPDVVILAQHKDHSMERFRAIAAYLQQLGVGQVVVLGPVPQWKPDLNKVIARHYWTSTPDRLKDFLDPGIVVTNDQMRATRRDDDPFVYVDFFAALCNERGCRTYLDGDKLDGLMAYDYGHFTPRASEFVARTIVGPAVTEALQRTTAGPTDVRRDVPAR